MMRNWKMLGLQTILAAAFSAAPGTADDAGKVNPTTPPVGKSIEKQLEDQQKAFTDLTASVKESLGKLNALEASIKEDFGKVRVDVAAINARIRDIEEKHKKDVEDLRKEILQKQIVRRSVDPTATDLAASQATGRLFLVNNYPREMTFVVNGQSYRLVPGQSLWTAPLPTGTFTYEVIGVQLPLTRPLAPTEFVQLSVGPRQR